MTAKKDVEHHGNGHEENGEPQEKAVEIKNKVCFIVCPISDPGTDTRKRSDIVLEYIIQPALSHCGYRGLRADMMDEPGVITAQVIKSVLESPLVIADLTERNPNVMYELALRHVIKRPFVQIIHNDDSRLPFDISQQRTIRYDHRDFPLTHKETIPSLVKQIEAVEADPSLCDNPITMAVELSALRESGDPEKEVVPVLMSMIQRLESKVNALTRARSNVWLGRRTESELLGQSIGDTPGNTFYYIFPSGRIRTVPTAILGLLAGAPDEEHALAVYLDYMRSEGMEPETSKGLWNEVKTHMTQVGFNARWYAG
jgi:hypothetical protein